LALPSTGALPTMLHSMRKPSHLVVAVRIIILKITGLPSGQFEPFNSFSELSHTEKGPGIASLAVEF